MRPEDLQGLRDCCESEAAFERMQQILLKAEAERQQVELQTLTAFGDQIRHAIVATERSPDLEVLESLVDERTHELLSTSKRLQQEIADRQWAERALQESEQRFRALIENATDIIVILDRNGFFCYCSPSAERVLGYTFQDVIGRHATEFVHPEDSPKILQLIQEATLNPAISQSATEYRVRNRNGSWCIFEAVATSLLEDRSIGGVVVNCHDVTERKRAEEALIAANRRTVNILESITDAFVSIDTEWRLTYLNHRAAQVFQRSDENLLGYTLWKVLPEMVGSRLEQEAYQVIQQQVPIAFEEFYSSLNTWFEVRIFPSAEGLSIFFLDVTERRHEQAEILEMSAALGNAVEGIARLDLEGHYVALNRAYAVALGYQQTAMIGMSWLQTTHPDDIPSLLDAYEKMLAEGKAEVEVRGLRQDESTFHQEIVMVTAYNWHDQAVGHHCFTKDITERKRAEDAEKQQAKRERLMGAIAQRIRNSLNLEAILSTTVLEVRQFLKADRVVLFRLEPNGSGLAIAESVGSEWTSIKGLVLQGEGFQQRQIRYRQGKNLVVEDVDQNFSQSTLVYQEILKQWQVKSLLVVPILSNEQLWGVLAAHQCSTPRRWETFEIGLLEQLATQVAIALQQSELYRQVQTLNTRLEAQVQERTAQLQQALHFEAMLKRITDAVRDSLDEDQILQTAVQELTLGLGVEACDAELFDPEQQTSIICYEFIRSDMPSVKGASIAMAELAEIYDPLLQAQCFQFCRIQDGTIRLVKRQSAILVCPLMDDQRVIGNLWLFKPRSQAFANLEIRLVQQVANQCAIAIRQARLYQAAQAQVAALEEINQLKDDFLSTVSHELRTPMSNMKMAIHMLRTVTAYDRQDRYLDILQTECTREIELINDLLDLQRLEAASYPVSLNTIILRTFLLELVEPFESRTNERQQSLRLNFSDSLPVITTDEASLQRILAELLNNACKYTSPGGEVIFTVQALGAHSTGESKKIMFRVQNQAEIPQMELSRIFEKFYRVPNGDRWKQGGTGLGLALVQRLATELGGTIYVESQQGWTTFTVQLPVEHPLD